MLNHPHIASQLAQQRQREMVAQASQWRLRRQSLRGLAIPRGERLLTSRFGRPIAGLAAVLAMAVITACGGSSGVSGSGGDSSQTAVTSSSSSSSAAQSSTAAGSGGSARSLVGSAQAPAGCGPNHELDNCYSYDQMETLADVVIPMVEQYFNQEYAHPRPPDHYYYVANGVTGQEGCTDDSGASAEYNSQSYEYCSADNSVYLGQDRLWGFYQDYGAVSVAAGIAHEDTHNYQFYVGIPKAEFTGDAAHDQVAGINLEDQADCGAGAWAAYAHQQGWLEPTDFPHLGPFLASISDADGPGQQHGDDAQRTGWFNAGYDKGLPICNTVFSNGDKLINA